MSDQASRPAASAGAAWVMPAIRGPVVAGRGAGRRPSDLESGARDAWDAGFESGRREGMVAAEQATTRRIQELDAQLLHLRRLLQAMSRPLEELDDVAAAELGRLALTVGAQLARRELRIDPAQVIAIIRDCVALLPAAARHVRVHLHPEDAAAVRSRLAEPAGERAWTIIEDPVAGRGGCRILTETSQIDARFESRVAAAIGAVLGDDRSGDRSSADTQSTNGPGSAP
jgi:flagellar assembly protein FliH